MKTDEGEWWYCDGFKTNTFATGTQVGVRFDEPEKLTLTAALENVRPGGYIPEEHIKDMDIDGVDVSITYPSEGLLLYSVPDSQLLTGVFEIYNDWLAELILVDQNNRFVEYLEGVKHEATVH